MYVFFLCDSTYLLLYANLLCMLSGPDAEEAVETVKRGTGYNQSYIIRRLPPGALQTSRREM